jgi:pyruvate formate lyase activating enzyme
MADFGTSRHALRVQPVGEAALHPPEPWAEAATDHDPAARADEPLGFVHSIEAGSSVDGPGLRLVVFLTGCTLRCQYCHNPDTWDRYNGRPTTLARMRREIGKYAVALRVAGGGVTLSGGEPLMQPAFTRAVLAACREMGLHTALDTSGRLGAAFSDDDLALVDLHLLDIKSGDPETYARVTGQPLQPTLDYAARLSALGRPLWVRFVLVPGLTDAPDNVARVADICAGLRGVERVEVLPFHQMGREKYRRLGIAYPLDAAVSPEAAVLARVRGQFAARGLTVR